MEASTANPTGTVPIGVIDPSGNIAPALSALGFDVVGGSEFRSAATAIADEAASTHGIFPIIIVDHDAHGIDVWTEATSRLTPVATLTTGSGPLSTRADALHFPVSLNSILARLGIETTSEELGQKVFDGAHAAQKTEPTSLPRNPYLDLQPKAQAPENPYRALRSRADIARAATPTPSSDAPAGAAPISGRTPQQPLDATDAPASASPATSPTTGLRTAEDFDDDARYFAERAARQGRTLREHRTRATHELANVVFVASAKGGVGKSTTALQLAHYAATIGQEAGAGFRVTLIDGNRGQGDLRGYLWIPDDATLPTVYDAIAKGPKAALIEPKFYGAYRQKHKLAVPDFSIILTPPPLYATPRRTHADVYLDVIAHAREVSDLVIVDTQVLEAEKTDLWRNAFLPTLLGPSAWLLALANETAPAMNNLRLRLAELTNEHSLSKAHILLMATMFDEFQADDHARFAEKLGNFGQVVGATGYDPEVRESFNTGRIESRFASTETALRIVLNQVTNRYDLFDPIPEPERPSVLELLRMKKPKPKVTA